MKSSKGFTIIELIVVIAVFMFVISAVVVGFHDLVSSAGFLISHYCLTVKLL